MSGFGGIVTCTESEVEKIRYRCEVLSKRCFGPMTSLDEQRRVAASYFNDNICQALHCENGIMKVCFENAPTTLFPGRV